MPSGFRLSLDSSDAQLSEAELAGSVHGRDHRLGRCLAVRTDDQRQAGVTSRLLAKSGHQSLEVMTDQRIAVEAVMPRDIDPHLQLPGSTPRRRTAGCLRRLAPA